MFVQGQRAAALPLSCLIFSERAVLPSNHVIFVEVQQRFAEDHVIRGSFNVEFTVFSAGCIFPTTFSVEAAFERREAALQHLARLKARSAARLCPNCKEMLIPPFYCADAAGRSCVLICVCEMPSPSDSASTAQCGSIGPFSHVQALRARSDPHARRRRR
jgi:hypothetical protein